MKEEHCETIRILLIISTFIFFAWLLFFFQVRWVAAQALTQNYCYNSSVEFINLTAVNLSWYENCTYGCDNTTGACFGSNPTSSVNAMWLTFAVGSLFLVLATVLGLPYGNLTGEKKKAGFDTTIVIKYMFFFVGLYLMYLSMGMAYRNTEIYGGESNIMGGVNTSVMVIMITLILFLFVFFLEFFWTTIMNLWNSRKSKEWEERENF